MNIWSRVGQQPFAMMLSFLVFLNFLVAVCQAQITTTSCGLTKACVKIPTSCTSSTDCHFLMTYKRNSTNQNIMEFELSSKQATGYVALGFNQAQTMVGTKGEVCNFGVGGAGQFKGFSLINYNPVFESVAANTVLASIESVNGAIVCRFSRPITPSGYQSSLGPSVYPIFATGPVVNGSPTRHSSRDAGPNALDLTAFVPGLSTATPKIDLTGCDVDKGCYRVPSACKIGSCKFIITWKPDLVRQEIQIELHAKATAWVGFGLNKVASSMGGTYGEVCYKNLSGNPIIKTFYAAGHSRPPLANFDGQNVKESQIIAANGALTCRYTRKFAPISQQSVKVNQNAFLVIAAGDGTTSPLSYHKDNRHSSTKKFNLATISGKIGTKGEVCLYEYRYIRGFSLDSYSPTFQSAAANVSRSSFGTINGTTFCRFTRSITPSGYQSSLGPSVYPIFAAGGATLASVIGATPNKHSYKAFASAPLDLTAPFIPATTTPKATTTNMPTTAAAKTNASTTAAKANASMPTGTAMPTSHPLTQSTIFNKVKPGSMAYKMSASLKALSLLGIVSLVIQHLFAR
eukprot:gene8182-9059_t